MSERALAAIAQMPDLRAIVIAAQPSERRERLARQYAVESVSTIDSLLKRAIDCVYIAQPNYLHASSTISCLRAGKHVLLEKPFALNSCEAEAVASEARRAAVKGVRFLLAMSERFEPNFLRALNQRDSIGALKSVEMRLLRRSGIPQRGSWFTQKKYSGGGVLLDLGAHLLDQAFYFLDDFEFVEVQGVTRQVFGHKGQGFGNWGRSTRPALKEFDVEDQASFSLLMASGLRLKFELAWASSVKEDLLYRAFRGELGALEYDSTQSSSTIFLPSHEGLTPLSSDYARLQTRRDSLSAQPMKIQNIYEFFVEALEHDYDLLSELERALQVQRAIDAIYLSSQRAEPVRMNLS